MLKKKLFYYKKLEVVKKHFGNIDEEKGNVKSVKTVLAIWLRGRSLCNWNKASRSFQHVTKVTHYGHHPHHF